MELFLKLIPHITAVGLALVCIRLISMIGNANRRIFALERAVIQLHAEKLDNQMGRPWEALDKYNKIAGGE
jgi:hypothetical protein